MLQSVAHLNFILSCYTYILFCVYLVMYFIHIFVDVCVYCLVKVFTNFIGAV